MENMESSNPNKVYDEVRGAYVAAIPEEIIRQKWLQLMIHELGYPKELLVVERELSQLPHLVFSHDKLPNRKVDILCYAKGINDEHTFHPLLLMECKKPKLTKKDFDQLIGYNHHVGAHFVALVNETEIFINNDAKVLLSYSELLKRAKDAK